MDKKITIIGCGVIGLTTGIRLLEANYEVTIVTKEMPQNTTSNWAAAIWFPYHVYPFDKAIKWGSNTYNVFQTLLNVPSAGVRNTTMYLLEPDEPERPWWADAVPDYQIATKDELPDGYEHAYKVTVPVCDTSLYLDYLLGEFRRFGGTVEQREIKSFDEFTKSPSIVINCTGLSSYHLADDKELYPVRGQVVKVKQPDVSISLIRDFGAHHPSYIIPRMHDIILGGTAQEGDWNESVDADTSQTILEQTKLMVPELASAQVLEQGVALRPGRSAVRLEAEPLNDNCTIIHNYGHGGAGFTLSWGCADEVVELVNQIAKD